VYAGTFGRVNHLTFLLEVAQRLQDYPAIEFWLIGDGAEKPLLLQKAQHLPRVRFLKPVPVEEVPYYLSLCHIGVSTVLPIPLLETNSANKFYDYLAAGLVVGLNYRGWQAALLESTGCGFGAWNVKEFAERVLFYYWHRAAWERAASRSRELAEKMFDRRQLAQELLPHLNRLSL
jgi:glycosyltransferase involved in cell wall biosynthesis